MFSGMFTNNAAGNGQRPDADQVFGDAFEDVCHLLLSLSYDTLLGPSNGVGGYSTRDDRSPHFFFFGCSFYDRRSNGISRCGHGWAQHAVLV